MNIQNHHPEEKIPMHIHDPPGTLGLRSTPRPKKGGTHPPTLEPDTTCNPCKASELRQTVHKLNARFLTQVRNRLLEK